jgi:hypothetical protein
MIMQYKSLMIAVAIAGTAFAAGALAGQILSDGHWRKVRLEDARQTAVVLSEANARLTASIGEREQCRAEVSKINEATAKSAERMTQMIAADQAQRGQAEQRAIVRQRQSEARLVAAFSTLDELRRLIDEGAFHGCANERIGADIVGMLNDALGGHSRP